MVYLQTTLFVKWHATVLMAMATFFSFLNKEHLCVFFFPMSYV